MEAATETKVGTKVN